jgi:transcription initiation factor IIF auxiliary subunit
MTLKIAQDSQCEGPDWWKWSVWLEGPDAELDEVSSVEWLLHPTFPSPVREITDRTSRFKLQSAGWGEFLVKARVHKKSNKVLLLAHSLHLEAPPKASPGGAKSKKKNKKGGKKTAAAKTPSKVFISYGASEARAAGVAKTMLEARGIQWTDASVSAEESAPLRTALTSSLSSSDAVIALRSGGSGPWSDWEVSTAQAQGVPVISVKLPETSAENHEDTLREQLAPMLDEYGTKEP